MADNVDRRDFAALNSYINLNHAALARALTGKDSICGQRAERHACQNDKAKNETHQFFHLFFLRFFLVFITGFIIHAPYRLINLFRMQYMLHTF